MENTDLTKRKKIERHVMTYGMFVFMFACEMMIRYVVKGNPENLFSTDTKFYYNKYKKGSEMALHGMEMLTERIVDLYNDLGGILKTDEIRRDACMMIRMFIDSRNYIKNKEDATKLDSTLFNMSQNRENLISSELRSDFIMK